MRLRTRLVGLVATLTIPGDRHRTPHGALGYRRQPSAGRGPHPRAAPRLLTSLMTEHSPWVSSPLVGWAAWAFLAASLPWKASLPAAPPRTCPASRFRSPLPED